MSLLSMKNLGGKYVLLAPNISVSASSPTAAKETTGEKGKKYLDLVQLFQLSFSILFPRCSVACLMKPQQIKPFFLSHWNYLMKQRSCTKNSPKILLRGMGTQQN